MAAAAWHFMSFSGRSRARSHSSVKRPGKTFTTRAAGMSGSVSITESMTPSTAWAAGSEERRTNAEHRMTKEGAVPPPRRELPFVIWSFVLPWSFVIGHSSFLPGSCQLPGAEEQKSQQRQAGASQEPPISRQQVVAGKPGSVGGVQGRGQGVDGQYG